MAPWWLLAVAPLLAAMLTRSPSAETAQMTPRASLAATAMLAVILGAVVLSTPWLERFNPVFGSIRSSSRPEANIQAAADRLSGRVFTRLEWGEYLDWAAFPKARVFMDGRIEIYPDDLWRQYNAVSSGQSDWQAILDAHNVEYVLLDADYHTRLLPHVQASSAWRPVFRSGPAVLFARRAADFASSDPQRLQ
jgi:hypothetical protein